jgi:hypothetical protein
MLLSSAHSAPPTAAAAIEMLVGALTGRSLFSRFDLTAGSVEIDAASVTICCRDAAGHPTAIRYGAASNSVTTHTVFPLSTIAALAAVLV